MKTQHTPGPWETAGKRDGLFLVRSVEIEGGPFGAARSLPICNAFTEANAELIASAPDLLTALEQIEKIAAGGVVLRHETGKPQWSALTEMSKIARAAINKAQGKE